MKTCLACLRAKLWGSELTKPTKWPLLGEQWDKVKASEFLLLLSFSQPTNTRQSLLALLWERLCIEWSRNQEEEEEEIAKEDVSRLCSSLLFAVCCLLFAISFLLSAIWLLHVRVGVILIVVSVSQPYLDVAVVVASDTAAAYFVLAVASFRASEEVLASNLRTFTRSNAIWRQTKAAKDNISGERRSRSRSRGSDTIMISRARTNIHQATQMSCQIVLYLCELKLAFGAQLCNIQVRK